MAVLLMGCAVYAQAPASKPGVASTARSTFLSEPELARALEASPVSATRHTARLLEGTPYNVTFERLDAVNNASIHQYAEIYLVRAGAGVLLTGGMLLNANPPANGTIGGTSIEGGDRQTIKAGDVVYIPSGTAHVFASVDPSITYLLVRFPIP